MCFKDKIVLCKVVNQVFFNYKKSFNALQLANS